MITMSPDVEIQNNNISTYGVSAGEGYKCGIISSSLLNSIKEELMDAYIYGMTDPQTQELRYIGRTIQPLASRLRQHIDFSRRKGSMCGRAQWIRSLLALGLKPEIFEIETVPLEDSPSAEGEWTTYFRYIGANLLNEVSHNVGGSRPYIVDWTPDKLDKLGKVSDSELAVEFGIDRKSVEYKRRYYHIPRKPQTNFVVPPMAGWNRIELPTHIIERLGTVSDMVLAQEIGVAKSVIARAREERNIEDWASSQSHPTRFKSGKPHPRWSKPENQVVLPESIIERLGKDSDMQIAEELGLNNATIARIRKERGIPARSRKGNPKRKKEGGDAHADCCNS